MRRIESRTALITGASSGLGAELARQLAAQGVAVGLTARREPELKAVAAEIRAGGGAAHVASADVADADAFRAALARLIEALGPVDLLIANAGVGPGWSVDQFSASVFEQVLRVNLLGTAHAIEAVLPSMLERRRGHLVGISSLAAYRGLPGEGWYCASKAGLSTMMESLRVDLRGRGVAVTTIHPGFVRTAMTSWAQYDLPFLLEVGPAVRIMLRGIAARRREVNFPWQMAIAAGLMRSLPNVIYDRLKPWLE